MNRMLRCNIFIQQALEHTIKCHYGIYTHTYTCTKNIDFGQLHTPWGNHYRSTVSNFSQSKLNVILQPAKTRNQSVWLLSEVGFWTMADKLHMSLFPAPFRLQLHFFFPLCSLASPPNCNHAAYNSPNNLLNARLYAPASAKCTACS